MVDAGNFPPNPDGTNCPDRDQCQGLRDQLHAHEIKLSEYMANPALHDHKGLLGHGRDAQVIEGGEILRIK